MVNDRDHQRELSMCCINYKKVYNSVWSLKTTVHSQRYMSTGECYSIPDKSIQ